MESYRFAVKPSAASASNREDVVLAFDVDGGPRAVEIVPHVRVSITWTAVTPDGATTAQSFPPSEDPCASPALGRSLTIPMQAKQSARIHAEVVGCRGRSAVEETRARAASSIEWIPPYLSDLEVPAVLVAGTTARGTVRFHGIDGPGAPPSIKITSSHPGITITRQPVVAASSTFDIAVRPDASGEAKLTAEHVDTNGSGRIVGVLRKSAFVRVQSRR